MIRIEKGEFGAMCAACGSEARYELIIPGMGIRFCARCANELREIAIKVCEDARREELAERAQKGGAGGE